MTYSEGERILEKVEMQLEKYEYGSLDYFDKYKELLYSQIGSIPQKGEPQNIKDARRFLSIALIRHSSGEPASEFEMAAKERTEKELSDFYKEISTIPEKEIVKPSIDEEACARHYIRTLTATTDNSFASRYDKKEYDKSVAYLNELLDLVESN